MAARWRVGIDEVGGSDLWWVYKDVTQHEEQGGSSFMRRRHREIFAYLAVASALIGGLFHESLLNGKVLSPADVLLATKSFAGGEERFEPSNKLLIDPVLQFQPWLEFNRAMLRQGRLPLWNPWVGCGAPHLANGQSAVFDPFNMLGYLGTFPEAHAWLAAGRLLAAGLGMFLLASAWGLGGWGRWFAGLAFPFSGFLMVWLLYPVTNSAIWLPWGLLATHHLLEQPTGRRLGLLALVVGLVLLGGHVQTAAHVLLAMGLYAVWQLWKKTADKRWRAAACWGLAVTLGVMFAAIEVVPLGFYLSRSPVWADRKTMSEGIFELGRPRLLDAICVGVPYAYGSQRKGHPNLARAIGVHNLNESAGGYAGLATLLWLAPMGAGQWWKRREARFLTVLVGVGFCGAFGLPLVSNLFRAVPVLDVMDHRRLTLWVAFGLVMLGGMGLDRLGEWESVILPRWWAWGWLAMAGACLAVAGGAMVVGPKLKDRAIAHYQQASQSDPTITARKAIELAERQVKNLASFVPKYYGLIAGELALLAGLAIAGSRGRLGRLPLRQALVAITLVELVGFGYGLNPAIAKELDRVEPPVITYLKREAAPPSRVLAIGAELPPNSLMRYGLADVRNYDSVEMLANFECFEPLYEPAASRTSRREVTWRGVERGLEALKAAGVTAVVGATEPPSGLFEGMDRVGAVWVGRIKETVRPLPLLGQGPTTIVWTGKSATRFEIPTTFDPGWRATVDGDEIAISPGENGFLSFNFDPGKHVFTLRYDPFEVRAALLLTAGAGGVLVLLLTGAVGAVARGRKNPDGSWKAKAHRVRIESSIPKAPVCGSL